jgi:hypothetical protein
MSIEYYGVAQWSNEDYGHGLDWVVARVMLWYNGNSQLHPSPEPSLRTGLWSRLRYLVMTSIRSRI